MSNEPDAPGPSWHEQLASRVGKAVRQLRGAAGISAEQLSKRCAELGAPIHRVTISKIENGRSRFDLGELIVLAAALNTSPVCLVFPDSSDDAANLVDVLPSRSVTGFQAAQWFSGLKTGAGVLNIGGGADVARNRAEYDDNTRQLRLRRDLKALETRQGVASVTGPDGRLTDAQQEELRRLQVQIVAKRSELGLDPLAGLDPFAVDPFGAGA